jgi:hypothetical protein
MHFFLFLGIELKETTPTTMTRRVDDRAPRRWGLDP